MKNNMTTNTGLTNQDALRILSEVKSHVGRLYKSQIANAWMDGRYYNYGLEKWASQLQQIRNAFGPEWLVKAKVK